MKTRSLLIAAVATTLVVAGCKKDDNSPASSASSPTSTVNPMLSVFANNLNNAAQTFNVSATTSAFISGANGTQIVFPPNAFRTSSGGMVTGNVQVQLVEALTVGKMIWLNKQTLGNDGGQMRPLVSGGQYFLNVTQGGQQLKLADNAGQVYVPAPNGADPSMQLFSGSVDGAGTITWNPFANAGALGLDSSNYSFPNDSLGWVNCDYYMSTGTQTTVQVTCPAGYNADNTVIWLVFPDQNSVTGLHDATANVFSTGSYYTLPIGMNMKIVAIASINGAYSSSVTSAVVSANMNATITFLPTTLAQFETDVNAL